MVFKNYDDFEYYKQQVNEKLNEEIKIKEGKQILKNYGIKGNEKIVDLYSKENINGYNIVVLREVLKDNY